VSDEEDSHSTATAEDVTPAEDGDALAVGVEDAEPPAVSAEEAAEDRLFGLVAFGLMILLLICVVLVLIADRRPPAGL
jgi:hypothetical protein